MQTAKTRLETAIADAAKLKEEDYTTDTWKALKKALDDAKNVDYTSDTSAEINNMARNIEEAMIALVTKEDDEKVKAIKSLKEAMQEAEGLNEAKYTEKTWENLEDVLNEIKPHNGVYTGLTIAQIKDYTTRLTAALEGLEETLKRNNVISQLNGAIVLAEEQTEESWVGDATWQELQTALSAAKDVYEKRDEKTYKELKATYDDLSGCLGL